MKKIVFLLVLVISLSAFADKETDYIYSEFKKRSEKTCALKWNDVSKIGLYYDSGQYKTSEYDIYIYGISENKDTLFIEFFKKIVNPDDVFEYRTDFYYKTDLNRYDIINIIQKTEGQLPILTSKEFLDIVKTNRDEYRIYLEDKERWAQKNLENKRKDLTIIKNKIKEQYPYGILKSDFILNSVGGIQPFFSYFNTSNKTIKNISLTLRFKDCVGDICTLRYNTGNTVKITGIGFIESFTEASFSWENDPVAYSSIADSMEVISITVKYKDNTTRTYTKSQVDKMY